MCNLRATRPGAGRAGLRMLVPVIRTNMHPLCPEIQTIGWKSVRGSQSARCVRETTSGWSLILLGLVDVSTERVVNRAWPAAKIQSTQ